MINQKNKPMKDFKNLMKKLTALSITQKSSDWAEDIPHEIWDEYFEYGFKEVARGLVTVEHRWYTESVTVVSILGGFIGINHVTQLKSENMDIEDCGVTIEFDEMEEVTVTSYQFK